VKPLTDDEIERFCAEALRKCGNGKSVYRLGYAFILILNTGIQMGEALALRTHGDINFAERHMTIDSNMSYVKQREESEKRYGFVEGTPKTRNGKRILPLNEDAFFAAQELVRLNESFKFLLSNSQGNLTPPHNLERSFKRILRNAGIEERGIHTLRHTYATALFKQKVDIKVISSLLGHSNVKITYDTYVHLTKDQVEEAVGSTNLMKAKNDTACGEIIYDGTWDALNIRFESNQEQIKLRAGTPIEVFLCEQWVTTCVKKRRVGFWMD